MLAEMSESRYRFAFRMRADAAPARSAATGLAVMVAACLASPLWSSPATAAEPEAPVPAVQFVNKDDWRAHMAHVPVPKKGCFTTAYPDTVWHEVKCRTPPALPYPPARGPRSDTVGGGNDYSAKVSPHTISQAVGSFTKVQGVTKETGTTGGNNAFSLQLNTQFFGNSPACNKAKTPKNCQGWQQFVYSNVEGPHLLYMQYWLINYDATCPAGWFAYGSDCYTNSSGTDTPTQKITSLSQLILTGKVKSGGLDTATLSVDGKLYTATGEDSMLDTAKYWQIAEFNIVGDCCSSQANFNSGSTITVQISVEDGNKSAPSCDNTGFTAETNNLTFVKTTTVPPKGSSPEIAFTQSNAKG